METGERMALPSVSPPPRALCGEGERKREESLFRLAGDGRGRDAKGECALDPSPVPPSLEAGKTTQKGRHIGEKEGGERGRERGGAPPNYMSFFFSLTRVSPFGGKGGREELLLSRFLEGAK